MNEILNVPDDNNEIVLTQEQQLVILEMLNKNPDRPPKIRDILLKVFGKELAATSKEGRIVRKFIADKGLQYQKAKEWVPTKIVELTEEQKTFISNNCTNMKPLEMARLLFKNENLTNLDLETREIYKHISSLPKNLDNRVIEDEKLNVEDYKPPKTEDQAIARINKYVTNANLKKEKLTEKQKRDIKNLIGYLHTIRFLQEIASYSKVLDRELFESDFIRNTYNKDLAEHEVSQYIMCCTDTIIAKDIKKRISEFEAAQDEWIAEHDNKPNMTYVEATNGLRNEYNQCINRQKTLLKALEGERQKRMELQKEDNTSILDLLSYWKDYERRQYLNKLAIKRDESLKNEIDRLKSLDDIKLEIFGISERELLGT